MNCPLCDRDVPGLERHHLSTRRKDKEGIEDICPACHDQIHALYTNTELRDERLGLDTIEGLLENERFQKALKFIRKQPVDARVTTRLSKHAKRH